MKKFTLLAGLSSPLPPMSLYIAEVGEIVCLHGLSSSVAVNRNGGIGKVKGVKDGRVVIELMNAAKSVVLVKLENFIDSSVNDEDNENDNEFGEETRDSTTESQDLHGDDDDGDGDEYEGAHFEISDDEEGIQNDQGMAEKYKNKNTEILPLLEQARELLKLISDPIVTEEGDGAATKILDLCKEISRKTGIDTPEGGKNKHFVSLKSELVTIISMVGIYYQDTERYERSRQCFLQALKIDPKSSWTHFHLSNVDIKLGLEADAIRRLHEAVIKCRSLHDEKENPIRTARCFLLISSSLLRMTPPNASRDLTIVVKSLIRSINLCDKNRDDPASSEVLSTAFFLLGQVLGLMHYKSGSIMAYEKALEVSPHDISFLVALANAIRTRNETNDLDEAIKIYLKAVSLDPTSAQLHRHVGSAYMQKGSLAEAIGAFTRSVALSREGDEWVPQVNMIINTLTEKLRSHQQGQIIVDLP